MRNNKNMEMHKYKVFKNLNPLTNEYEYHMFIRHLITPQGLRTPLMINLLNNLRYI